jgi:hypothetical protein
MAAVVVSRTRHGNLHAGIAHRVSSREVCILHLAWDCDLKNERFDSDTVSEAVRAAFRCPAFVIPEVDDDAELELVAGLCRRVYNAIENQSITFCIGYPPDNAAFINDQGVFRVTDSRLGLTCAGLVIKIFNKAKIALVKVDDWPARSQDILIQESLIGFMEQQLVFARECGLVTTMTQAKIDFNKQQVGTPRVAPEEVAGACLEPRTEMPVGFAVCERRGREIVEILDQHENMIATPAPPTQGSA